MQNWRSYRNFRRYRNADGSHTYTITVDNTRIEVSEEIYTVYAAFGYKMENMETGFKRDRVLKGSDGKAIRDEYGQPILLPEREVSLDKLANEDWEHPSSDPLPEDIVAEQLEIIALHTALDLLAPNERELVTALFFDGLTEREYSSKTGIAQKTINDRKHRVFVKLERLLKK